MTIVEKVLLDDPDLENAKFHILDFSCPSKKEPRRLAVIDAQDIPRVTDLEMEEMLAIFVQGFELAKAVLADVPPAPASHDERDDRQGDLFDEDC